MAKPLPPDPVIPPWTRLRWRLWDLLTWPSAVRQLKRAGFRRVGWMAWESGPLQERGDEEGAGHE